VVPAPPMVDTADDPPLAASHLPPYNQFGGAYQDVEGSLLELVHPEDRGEVVWAPSAMGLARRLRGALHHGVIAARSSKPQAS
jgi:hypothetical protein